MSGSELQRLLLWFIPPVTIGVILAVFALEPDARFYVTLAFWSVAYLMVLLSSSKSYDGRAAFVLGATLRVVTVGYLGVQSVLALLLLLPIWDPSMAWVIVLQLIPFALFLMIFLSTSLSNDAIAARVGQQEEEITWLRRTENSLQSMRAQAEPATAVHLDRLIEAVRFSPTQGHPEVEGAEWEIGRGIAKLAAIQRAGADASEIEQVVRSVEARIMQRNRDLRTLQ